MEFKIPDIVVPDWRCPPREEKECALTPRPMSDQVWDILESLTSRADIAGLMHCFKAVDAALKPDGEIDAEEWEVCRPALHAVLADGRRERVAEPLQKAFALQIDAAVARRKTPSSK